MIEHRIEGDKELLAGLEKVSSAQARADLMDRLAQYGVASTHERFENEVSPEGKPWQKSMRAIEEGGKTLQDKRHLYQSITSDSGADFAAWGSNVKYAGIHQMGGEIRPKSAKALAFNVGGRLVQVQKVTMPARPYLGISAADAKEIPLLVHDWLTEALQ